MKQITVLLSILLTAALAQAISEQDYLTKNKAYTDGLLAQFQFEDKANRNLANLKVIKKNLDATLKNTKAELDSTVKKLTKEQAKLTSLKDKELNKTQLESSLNSQKQKNLSKISSLNGQISNTNSSLQNVNFTVSQLENEKNLIASKYNTQQQVVAFAQDNVDDLEREIWQLEWDIERAQDKIRKLNKEIAIWEAQKLATDDPATKAQLELQISQNENRIRELENEISFTKGSLQSKKFQLINEKSDLNQEKNKLSSLQIQLNGKQNELNSQYNLQNQLESELSSLQSQKSSLVSKNQDIDAELDVLANLPAYIAKSEQAIQNLNVTKTQQEAALIQAQTDATTTDSAIANVQKQIDTAKATVLASEKDHDAVLKEFLAGVAPVIPTVIGDGVLSIDSLLVTEEIAKSKDWSVFRGTSTTLGGVAVCAASTQVLDSVSGVLSELFVLKLGDAVNGYSSPFVFTTHSRIADLVVKGQLKTDGSKSILLPLLQSPVANEKALIARYSDNEKLVSYLKAHNSAKVEFTVPGAPVTVPFSLRGSSAMVNKMLETCTNK